MPNVSGVANFSSIYGGNDGSATIVCDGNGGYEPVLNSYAGAPCGIDQCVIEHERSHASDWAHRYPDGCAGKAEGAGIPTSGGDYSDFLNQSECDAYEVGRSCLENLFRNSSPACAPTVQAAMEHSLRQQENSCQASYP